MHARQKSSLTKQMPRSFLYSNMWHHYIENVGEPTDDVVVQILKTDYVAMKYESNKSGNSKPFKHINMNVWKTTDDYFVQHPFFEKGCFIAERSTEKSRDAVMRKKNLFLVGPKEHRFQESNKTRPDFVETKTMTDAKIVVSADHLSFVINKGDVNKTPLHFHATFYIPNVTGASEREGFAVHQKGFMETAFELPDKEDFRPNGKWNQTMSDTIYDILVRHMCFPAEHRRGPDNDGTTTSGGGGRSKKKKIKKKMMKMLDVIDAKEMFRRLPIDTVRIIGVRRLDKYDVTITFRDRLHHKGGHTDHAFVVEMTQIELTDDEYVESVVAGCMIGKSRYDFEDVLSP